MSTDNIDEFTELRKIFTKYTFSRENGVVFVKFGDFSSKYSEDLSIDIHSVIEKYDKFSLITIIDNSLVFNFPTFNVTTNLVDYSIDFEYSKGDVSTFNFVDFITSYEKLFNESQELRDKFNNYDICITIDLHLMVKFRDMISFELNMNKEIHDNIRGIIEYLTYNCTSYINNYALLYEFENYKISIEFDKIIIRDTLNEDKILYSFDELKAFINPKETEENEEIEETVEIKETEKINEFKIVEETDFSKLLKKNTKENCTCDKNGLYTRKSKSRVFSIVLIHFTIIMFIACMVQYLTADSRF